MVKKSKYELELYSIKELKKQHGYAKNCTSHAEVGEDKSKIVPWELMSCLGYWVSAYIFKRGRAYYCQSPSFGYDLHIPKWLIKSEERNG